MLNFLETFFSTYGYLAVFSILILCGLGIPIPEDISLVAGGIISGLGKANLYIMIIVGMLGVLIGDGLMFTLGRVFGYKFLHFRWTSKLLTPERYIKVQQKFDRYGNSVIFIARFLPGLRTPIYITAGMSKKVSYINFFLMDGFAAIISVPLWIWVGYYGAENKKFLLEIISNFKTIIIIILSIVLFIVVVKWYRKRKQLIVSK